MTLSNERRGVSDAGSGNNSVGLVGDDFEKAPDSHPSMSDERFDGGDFHAVDWLRKDSDLNWETIEFRRECC